MKIAAVAKRAPKTDNIPIGRRIKQARERRGLTIADLARKLDTQWHTVSEYETGVTGLSPDRLFEIADLLEEDPRWIFEGVRKSREYTSVPDVAPALHKWLTGTGRILADLLSHDDISVLNTEMQGYNGTINDEWFTSKAQGLIRAARGQAASKLHVREKPPEPYDETPKVTKTKKR